MMAGRLRVSHPIYPLTAVGASLVILVLGLLLSAKPRLFACYLVGLCLLYLGFGYGGVLVKCLLVLVPVGILTGAVSWLVKGDWRTGLTTLGRVLLLGLAALTPLTTQPVDLTRCMNRLRMPRFLTLGMLVAIRFVPVLAGEVCRIREAMRTRGVDVAWYRVDSWYRAFLVPFFMQLIDLSDMLSVSLETRAFSLSDGEATIYRPVNFTARDAAFCMVLAALSLAAAGGVILL